MRNRFTKAVGVAGMALGTIVTGPSALATSTDGYHSIQIIPIAVQTASFSTSFFFHNPNAAAINVSVFYFPGVGTSTPGGVNCGVKALPGNNVVTYASLTALCPGITAGSNFGWIYTYEVDATNEPYAVFTRVDNPQAQGFEVESFPPHTFTAANMHVLGLRRTAGVPGASTNCFIGAPLEGTTVNVSLRSATNVQIGATQVYTLAANEFRRLLDIFATVGAPAGNYSNVRLLVTENDGAGEPGAIVFCTVQNNTTFDADFRIGKAFGVQDGHAERLVTKATDGLGNAFTLGTYPAARNRHTVYFKHPDWAQCRITRTDGGVLADLEMRLVAPDGTTVLAGGNDITSFGEIYLGVKSNYGGSNSMYYVDVEYANAFAAPGAAYRITCEAGSGVIGLEPLGRNLPDQF